MKDSVTCWSYAASKLYLPSFKKSELQHLCRICRKIDFESLMIKNDRVYPRHINLAIGLTMAPSIEKKSTPKLGRLDHLIARAGKCQFCALIVASARRLNNGESPPARGGEYDDYKLVTVSLEAGFFCSVDESGNIGMKKDTSIHRLYVNFEPAIFGFWSRIRFQLYKEGYDEPGLGRLMPPVLDLSLVKSWLQKCETSHGKVCHAPKWLAGEPEQPSFLKVIDVKTRSVITAPPNCRYFGLSYVWGDREQMNSQFWLSTRANRATIQEKNGIDMETLPKTIADTMELVLGLGERYLWVDALCIVQDDEDEIAEQTAQMDLVYASALLTVIVTAGDNSDSGLPGLRDGTRSVVQGSVKILNGYSLMQTNSRGWTFQERLLSRRTLFFTPEQVYWVCETDLCNEETTLEPGDPRIWVLPQALDVHDEWDSKPEKFTRKALNLYVTQYSFRQLTYEADVLAAFSGILRRMEFRNNEKYHWGLPHTRFDLALSWNFGKSRREAACRIVSEKGIVSHVKPPSWSWLGWKGFIDGPRYLNQTFNYLSELSFYKVGEGGKMQHIERTALGYEEYGDAASDTSSSVVKTKEPVLPFFPLREKWKGKTEIIGPLKIQPRHSGVPDAYVTPSQGNGGEEIVSQSNDDDFLDTGRIAFWTSHATIKCRISKTLIGKPTKRTTIGTCLVFDLAGKEASMDMLDGMIGKHFHEKFGVEEIHQYESREKFPLDFVVTSRFIEIGDKMESEILNLLVVVWSETEEGVAMRIGNATIWEKDWVELDREWKLVILG